MSHLIVFTDEDLLSSLGVENRVDSIGEIVGELGEISEHVHPRISVVGNGHLLSSPPLLLSECDTLRAERSDRTDKADETNIREHVAALFSRVIDGDQRVLVYWRIRAPVQST